VGADSWVLRAEFVFCQWSLPKREFYCELLSILSELKCLTFMADRQSAGLTPSLPLTQSPASAIQNNLVAQALPVAAKEERSLPLFAWGHWLLFDSLLWKCILTLAKVVHGSVLTSLLLPIMNVLGAGVRPNPVQSHFLDVYANASWILAGNL
jgi:hypothetical protein